jgi:hypothetical protein
MGSSNVAGKRAGIQAPSSSHVVEGKLASGKLVDARPKAPKAWHDGDRSHDVKERGDAAIIGRFSSPVTPRD